jgi:hypothetical protein
MIGIDKAKDWIRENIPMLAVVFENKYLGMLYDRFASLPGTKQKQVILGTVGGLVALIMVHLLISYLSLWSIHNQTGQSQAMVGVLRQYHKQQREQSGEIRLLEQNNALAAAGSFKNHLVTIGRNAGISPRMVQAEESNEGHGESEEGKKAGDLIMRRATVKLQRVNLSQLKNYLHGVEFGSYSLAVSSIKIKNDEKIRGYMDVELGIVAYLFGAAGEGA